MAPARDDNQPREITVSVDSFMHTRDAVIIGFEQLKGAIDGLVNTYRTYTNNILKGGGVEIEDLPMPTISLNHIIPGYNSVTPAPDAKKRGRKKGEKKVKDPNEPKRPQTAFLLFSRHARPLVKADLGDDAEGKAVEDEILKRYRMLTEDELNHWKQEYQKNKEVYDAEMRSYSTNKKAAGLSAEAAADDKVDVTMADASTDVVAGAAATPSSTESTSEESSSEEEESEDEAPPPPPKAPSPPKETKSKTPKASKSRKHAKENGLTPATVPVSSPLPGPPSHTTGSEKEKSPEKRKKDAKESKEASPEEPRKKKQKKSKVDDAPAPVSTPEVTQPEKKKKKRKSEGAAA